MRKIEQEWKRKEKQDKLRREGKVIKRNAEECIVKIVTLL